MKRTKFFLLLVFFFSIQDISAQDTIGEAAVASQKTSSSNEWQNWVFASSALVAAAVGVVIVSLNSGSTSH